MTESRQKRNWFSVVSVWFFTLILAAIIAFCVLFGINLQKARNKLFVDELLREYVRLQVVQGDLQGTTSVAEVRSAFESRRLDRATFATVNDFVRQEASGALDSLPKEDLYFTVHVDEGLYYIVFTKEPFRVLSAGAIIEPEP